MALTWKKLKYDEVSATSRILGRKTAGAGAIEELTLSEVLDFIGSAAEGDILYRGASAWARLGKGSDGQVLTLASGLPSWAAAGGGGGSKYAYRATEFTWNSASQDITDMVVAVEASKKYFVQIRSTLQGFTLLGGLFKFSLPSGASLTRVSILQQEYSSGIYKNNIVTDATSFGSQNYGGGEWVKDLTVDAIITISSTAGNIKLQSTTSSGTIYPVFMIVTEIQ